MSSANTTIVENPEFIERFIEVCDSDKPTVIKRLLNISDQAARNYLAGRFPTPEILITISEQTPYSIHWLLTGRGSKFVEEIPGVIAVSKPVFDEVQVDSIEKICTRLISEHHKQTQPKIVVLPAEKLKSEKAIETGAPVRKEEERKRSK